jgi:hypothetical protein
VLSRLIGLADIDDKIWKGPERMDIRTLMILPPLALLAAGPAIAGPREDTLAGISRCAALPDDRTFLDCIYGAAQPIRARLGLPPAPANQVRLVPPAASSFPQSAMPPQAGTMQSTRAAGNSGGILGGLFGGDSLHMATYSFDRQGLFTITLSNGEVWRQDPNDTNYAHWSGKASDYPMTLVSGEFGKSRLDVRGEPGPYIVERVR